MNTQEALIAAVLLDPADDQVRLIYADWLEENGQDGRAEFIRVQVEAARREPPYNPWCRKCGWVCGQCNCQGRSGWPPEAIRGDYLGRRERELLDAHAHEWLFDLPPGCRPLLPDAIRRTFSRGFIARVSLPLQAWREHGRQIARSHPVEALELSDREPALVDMVGPVAGRWFAWHSAPDGADRYPVLERLPLCIYRHLPADARHRGEISGFRCALFTYADSARLAANAAALAWARS